MASYMFMNTAFRGSRAGATPVTDRTVYQNYLMAPRQMNMNMHMIMLMYGATERLTLMAMGGVMCSNMVMTMDNTMSMGGMNMQMGNMIMTSSATAFTDTRISALYKIFDQSGDRIIASAGAGLPTGTINAHGTTMLGENQRLPYAMQTGAGSYSLLPGITYIHNQSTWALGADAGADIKLNYNELGYRCGNSYRVTTWASHHLLPILSASLRAEYTQAAMLSGSDKAMDFPFYQTADPTTQARNYGGKTVSLYTGLNFHLPYRATERFTLLAEYGIPVYQDLNGIQGQQRSNLVAALQYGF
jgi:hypothetical protein